MESLCSNLIKTYNTNYLDSEEVITQNSFYETSDKHKDGEKGRTTLMKCIVNHFTKQKPKVKYIGGPLSLTYHRQDRKHIYIFGESHSEDIDCPPQAEIMKVEDYLYELLKNTDVFLDIYFELEPPEARDYVENMRLTNIFYKFKNCIDYDTRFGDICRLGRIHYTNYRSMRKKTSRVTSFYQTLSSFVDIEKDELFSDSSIEILRTLSMINGEDEYNNLGLYIIRDNYYLNKELEKSFLKDNIINFITIKIKEELERNKDLRVYYSAILLDIFDEYKKSNLINEEILLKLYNAVDRLKDFMVSIIAREMDVYLLSRVFRKFDIKRPYAKANEKDDKYTDQPVEPYNIVIYAGDNHSEI